jgi:hypothetical protein
MSFSVDFVLAACFLLSKILLLMMMSKNEGLFFVPVQYLFLVVCARYCMHTRAIS